jgi:phosphoadenosine phosphosulfate reductase
MLSSKVEDARINYAKKRMEFKGLKIYQAQELVEEAVKRHKDKVAVCCSFGSCSVVVLHLALKFKSDIKVIFNNTGVEYPETIEYKNRLQQIWDLNLIETKPIKSFWQCVKEYGFPEPRVTYAKSKVGRTYLPKCCYYLKDLPLKKACEEFGIEAVLTGVRAAESHVRMFTIAQKGMVYFTKRYGGIWRYHPIALWTQEDVWKYLRNNNIPINPVYLKGIPRSGCMPCTGYLHWEKYLSKTNPKLYRYIQKLRRVQTLDQYIPSCVQEIEE